MRQFYEFWSQFINRSPSATDLQVTDSKDLASYIQVNSFALQNWSPVATEINRDDFLGISFSHHMEILNKTKDIDTVLFYIHETVMHRWDKYTLRDKLKLKIHETQKGIPNNFVQTIPSSRRRRPQETPVAVSIIPSLPSVPSTDGSFFGPSP